MKKRFCIFLALSALLTSVPSGSSADQMIADIQKMVASLRQANPNCIIPLKTLPPAGSTQATGLSVATENGNRYLQAVGMEML